MTASKRKAKVIAAVSGIVALALLLLLVLPRARMNIAVTEGNVRIFTGETDGITLWAYNLNRASFLRRLARQDPSAVYSAVVPLNNYYSGERINELIEAHDLVLEHIYLWTPGETGRMALAVENNTILTAKKTFPKKKTDPGKAALMQELERLTSGTRKVFALTIKGTAAELAALQASVKEFAAVDVMYNPDAERYAAQRGKSFVYIELPTKPDGAL